MILRGPKRDTVIDLLRVSLIKGNLRGQNIQGANPADLDPSFLSSWSVKVVSIIYCD